jgi:hypothetical protein
MAKELKKETQRDKRLAILQTIATIGVAIMIMGAQFTSPDIPVLRWILITAGSLVAIGAIIALGKM